MGLTKLIDLPLLDRFLSKIKLMTSRRTAAIPFGQVDSTSTSTAFTVQIPEITELYDGVCMYVKNGVVTSASGFTIKLNNFAALPVYQTMAAATRGTTIFNVNYTMLFVYNSSRVSGGCWDIFYGYNSNDNTLAYNIRHYQAARKMKSALYRYMFAFTASDGTLVPSCGTSNSTSTSKTLSTVEFDPFGPVYYYNTTTTVSAGSSPSASYLWRAYSTSDMRYAWNVSTSALTAKDPVFVRLAPQSNGMVKLDGNSCIVQTLPSTADGKVYMLLGYAYSAYQIEFDFEHPLYCYRNGAIQGWTGLQSEVASISTNLANLSSHAITDDNLSNYSQDIANAILDATGTNVPLIIDGNGEAGDTVYLTGTFSNIIDSMTNAGKTTFAFMIPLVQTPSDLDDYLVLSQASIGNINWTNSTVELTGIGNGILYSVVLSTVSGSSNLMSGTLSAMDLVLPIVDEEEF